MSPAVLLLTVSGLITGAGLACVLAGWRGAAAGPRARTGRSRRRPRVGLVQVTALLVAAAVLLLTGWPVAAVGAGLAVLFLPGVLGGAKASRQVIARAQALAEWTRRLADLLASGAASSIPEALRRAATTAPGQIAIPVRDLVRRLDPQGAEPALRQFAKDMHDPGAEKIAMVLILRERNGGPGLAEALTALADDLDERCRMVREVEAERAKPRSNMRTIVFVTFALVLLMVLFTRTFLDPYSTVEGEVGLVFVVAAFGFALRWMRRLSQPMSWPPVLMDPPQKVMDQ